MFFAVVLIMLARTEWSAASSRGISSKEVHFVLEDLKFYVIP